jgi:Tfp pilus assembly protein PilE
MKATGERFLMAGVVAVVLLVVASVGFQMVTDRNRNSAVAKMKKPEVIERYMQIQRANAGKAPAASGQGESRLPAETPPATAPRSESIAAFARAFERIPALQQDKRWADIDEILNKKPVKEWTEADWARIKEYVGAAQDLIQEIRRLAEMGGPAYELDFSKGSAMELPHLAKLREMARLLRADALLQGHSGNCAEAVEDIVAGFKLSAVVKDEPILISQLVRIAMGGICWDAAQSALPPEGIPADLARRLVEYAGRCDYRESFANSFSGEGFMGLEQFDQVREGRTGGTTSTMDNLFLSVYGSVFARPWLNMDEETYADTISRMGEISRLPYYEALPQMKEIDTQIEGLPWTREFSRLLLPALTRAIESQARVEAELNLMQIGISVEQYHASTGNYPATLDMISPSLGGSLPVDPFTGESYHYQLSGGSFLLYSVGSNLTDDGGTFDFRKGDIVWRREPRSNN